MQLTFYRSIFGLYSPRLLSFFCIFTVSAVQSNMSRLF
ncbi:hypothetical protein CKA32_003891 [Geitlerinema sp. FC II]|nr:hypothetical protein CKA32_003891 [Geitlerinema sp. FC II]